MISDAVPLDACLGVEGIPQSATGQTALLTGINAPAEMGRHIEGFPPPALKALIEQDNLFMRLRDLGKQCTFANSYLNIDPEQIPMRRRSVTTVMTMAALGRVRGSTELENGRAVTHDITRETLETRGYTGPQISPEEAARHLIETAEENDFTLFEHFLTDRAGHRADFAHAVQCLEKLQRFIAVASTFAEQPNRLFILTSDHGNIEDVSIRTHTKNPVPFVAIGQDADRLKQVTNLCDVTPAIIALYDS